MTHPANTPASGGDDICDFRPDLGAETREPSVRDILRSYYGCGLEDPKDALRFTDAYCDALAAIAAQPPKADGGVVPAGVDPHVLAAARQLSEIQRSQPEWLWFTDDKTDGIPVARYSFGRWAKVEGQAPYIRADLALAAAPPLNAGPEVGGGIADAIAEGFLALGPDEPAPDEQENAGEDLLAPPTPLKA